MNKKVSEKCQKKESEGRVKESPSPAISPLYKGLSGEKGRKGGTFSNHQIFVFHQELAFASSTTCA
jgi:hypothetical protein